MGFRPFSRNRVGVLSFGCAGLHTSLGGEPRRVARALPRPHVEDHRVIDITSPQLILEPAELPDLGADDPPPTARHRGAVHRTITDDMVSRYLTELSAALDIDHDPRAHHPSVRQLRMGRMDPLGDLRRPLLRVDQPRGSSASTSTPARPSAPSTPARLHRPLLRHVDLRGQRLLMADLRELADHVIVTGGRGHAVRPVRHRRPRPCRRSGSIHRDRGLQGVLRQQPGAPPRRVRARRRQLPVPRRARPPTAATGWGTAHPAPPRADEVPRRHRPRHGGLDRRRHRPTRTRNDGPPHHVGHRHPGRDA